MIEKKEILYNGSAWKVTVRDEADRSVLAEIFKLREYKVVEESIVKATSPILDVGAHAGFFTLYIRSLNSNVPIIAIEPEKNNIAFLKKHLKENNIKKVEIVEGALAEKTEERMLKISIDSHNHRLLSKNEKKEYTNIIKSISFKDIAREINYFSLVKMDIEGGEYEVFENLDNEDFCKIKYLIMEYHNQNKKTYKLIETKLREHGFGVQIFPSRFEKTMGFLWARNKRI